MAAFGLRGGFVVSRKVFRWVVGGLLLLLLGVSPSWTFAANTYWTISVGPSAGHSSSDVVVATAGGVPLGSAQIWLLGQTQFEVNGTLVTATFSPSGQGDHLSIDPFGVEFDLPHGVIPAASTPLYDSGVFRITCGGQYWVVGDSSQQATSGNDPGGPPQDMPSKDSTQPKQSDFSIPDNPEHFLADEPLFTKGGVLQGLSGGQTMTYSGEFGSWSVGTQVGPEQFAWAPSTKWWRDCSYKATSDLVFKAFATLAAFRMNWTELRRR